MTRTPPRSHRRPARYSGHSFPKPIQTTAFKSSSAKLVRGDVLTTVLGAPNTHANTAQPRAQQPRAQQQPTATQVQRAPSLVMHQPRTLNDAYVLHDNENLHPNSDELRIPMPVINDMRNAVEIELAMHREYCKRVNKILDYSRKRNLQYIAQKHRHEPRATDNLIMFCDTMYEIMLLEYWAYKDFAQLDLTMALLHEWNNLNFCMFPPPFNGDRIPSFLHELISRM